MHQSQILNLVSFAQRLTEYWLLTSAAKRGAFIDKIFVRSSHFYNFAGNNQHTITATTYGGGDPVLRMLDGATVYIDAIGHYVLTKSEAITVVGTVDHRELVGEDSNRLLWGKVFTQIAFFLGRDVELALSVASVGRNQIMYRYLYGKIYADRLSFRFSGEYLQSCKCLSFERLIKTCHIIAWTSVIKIYGVVVNYLNKFQASLQHD